MTKSKLSEISKELLEEMYTHMTITQIASIFDCSHATVLNYMKRYDIPRRKHSEKFIHGQEFSKEFIEAQEAAGKTGEGHPAWKGGSFIDKQGYRHIYVDGKYRREHRLVVEKLLGRKLTGDEDVHHKDKDRLNNDPENLEVLDKSTHNELHEGEKEALYG